MFMILEMRPIDSMPTLNNAKGAVGQQCRDSSNGDIYLKRSTGWVKILAGGTIFVEQTLPVTVKNSAGTVSRTLNESSPGVVNLAASDAIVANNDSIVLRKSDGTTVSSGNAGLNSPATAIVAAGVPTYVKAAA